MALLRMTLKGETVSGVPIAIAPSKNCTLATVPGAVSVAVAAIVMLLPVTKLVPFAGDVMLTIGGVFALPPQVPLNAVGMALVPFHVARKPKFLEAPVAIVAL